MQGSTYSQIIGQGVSGIGSGLSMIANMEEQAAMDEAIKNELTRQKYYAQEGSRYFANSLYGSTPNAARSAIGAGKASQLGLYNSLYGAAMPGLGQVTDPRQQARVGTLTKQMSNAGAQQMGYNTWLTGMNASNLYYSSLLNALAQRAKASSDVLSSEVQAAQNSEQNLDTWGKVVYDIGQNISSSGGGSSGGSGMFSGWKSE